MNHVVAILIGFLFTLSVAQDLPLPPLFVANVGSFSSQPSGLTYCSTTDRLYMNCDRCEYITELDTKGTFIQNLNFDASHRDIEAMACSDADGYLFIGEEGRRRVTAFLLGDYTEHSNGQKDLIEVYDFTVVTGSSTSTRSGLEGMTVNEKTGDIYVANEKGPAMIVRVHSDGEQFDSNEIEYLRDISGLAYDEELDLLWVLSDQDEKVYLTDLTGTEVLDSWDLPVKNPEGIAVNNNSDPKYLYIATDPSAPSGPQYLPLIVGFEKPVEGTGYVNYDPDNLPDYVTNPPPCDGCEEIFGEEEDQGDTNPPRPQPNNSDSDDNDSSTSPRLLVSSLVIFAVLFLFF